MCSLSRSNFPLRSIYISLIKKITWSKLAQYVSSSTVSYSFCWEVWKSCLPKDTHSCLSLWVNASWSLSTDDCSQPTFSIYCTWNRYSHLVAVLFLCWIFLLFLTKERNTIGKLHFFTSHVENGDMMRTISKSTNLKYNDAS